MLKFFPFLFFIFFNANLFAQYTKLIESAEKAMAEKQYIHAVSYYNDALKIDKTKIEPSLKKIACAIETKNLAIYKIALVELQNNGYKSPLVFYLSYVNIAQKQGNNREALAMLDKAALLFNHNKKILLQKADLLHVMHKTIEKMTLLNYLFLQDSTQAGVIYRLANHFYYSNPSKSIFLFKKLLHEKKYTNIALISLGKSYLKQYKKTRKKIDLTHSYSYYKLYANGHPKDKNIKKIIKELQSLL